MASTSGASICGNRKVGAPDCSLRQEEPGPQIASCGKKYRGARLRAATRNSSPYTGPVQMGARTFSTHINNGGGTFSRKHTYGANTFFLHFYAIFFTPGTSCADNKDKPIAGCKNQLLKKCLRNF